MRAGTKVIINRDGDIWDGSEGTVLDPSTFGSPHISDWILVQGCVEDEFGLRTGERFYPADALEVIETATPATPELGEDGWGQAAADYVSLWDSAADWAPLSSDALTEMLTDRYEIITYIIRLEMAVDVLRSFQADSDRFFDAVNDLDPDVCGKALKASKDRVTS